MILKQISVWHQVIRLKLFAWNLRWIEIYLRWFFSSSSLYFGWAWKITWNLSNMSSISFDDGELELIPSTTWIDESVRCVHGGNIRDPCRVLRIGISLRMRVENNQVRAKLNCLLVFRLLMSIDAILAITHHFTLHCSYATVFCNIPARYWEKELQILFERKHSRCKFVMTDEKNLNRIFTSFRMRCASRQQIDQRIVLHSQNSAH